MAQGLLCTLTVELARSTEATEADGRCGVEKRTAIFIAAASAHARSVGSLLAASASIAVAPRVSGIFGVVSYSVTQRYREFGVRIAMGAAARHIVFDSNRRSLAVTGIGIAVGLVIAVIGCRAIVLHKLYFLSPFDPITFAFVVVLLLGSAVAAAALPAVRATRVDPVVALRCE